VPPPCLILGTFVTDPSSMVCPSDSGPWPPEPDGAPYEVSVVTPAGVPRVHLLGADGEIVAIVPTVGCDSGFPACCVFTVTNRVVVDVRPAPT
jgi:hypothetical protein